MSELIVRDSSPSACSRSGTLDELKFCYEALTNIFNLAVINFRRGANGPRRNRSPATLRFSNALLNRTQLLELRVN